MSSLWVKRAWSWEKAFGVAISRDYYKLTSDKTRPGALRIYESLGFVASPEGFKLHFRRYKVCGYLRLSGI